MPTVEPAATVVLHQMCAVAGWLEHCLHVQWAVSGHQLHRFVSDCYTRRNIFTVIESWVRTYFYSTIREIK